MLNLSLEALVEKLPEVYQPIYGAPEIGAARGGDEARVTLLLEHTEKLSRTLGRKLRVLDLGSAQGYLTFRLAEVGHKVTGVDSLGANVTVARAIHARHPHLDVDFVEGDLLDILPAADLESYDVVVAFSVLHHIAHRDGQSVAARLVAELSAHIPHGLFEMALPTEPVFWAGALAAAPRATLGAYVFIREIGYSGTHLSDVQRPIFFCSQSLSLVRGELVPIVSHTDRPHAAANPRIAGTHRYYMLPIGIAKIAARFEETADEALTAELQLELQREAKALEVLRQAGLDVPELIEFAQSSTETILVRTAYPGVLLSEAIESLSDEERASVTTELLRTLADLEGRALYHRDLRLWNIIWNADAGRARLIDYGSIGPLADDTMWPFDTYFSVLTVLCALWARRPDQTGLDTSRRSGIDAGELPPPVARLIAAFLVHPRDNQALRDLSATWEWITTTEADRSPSVQPLAWEWLARVEDQRDEMRTERDAQMAEQVRLRAAHEAQLRLLSSQQEQLFSQQQQLENADAQVARLRAERDDLANQLEFLRQTVSWRVTAPLRRVRSLRWFSSRPLRRSDAFPRRRRE